MAARAAAYREYRGFGHFFNALSSAASEWLVIILLLINALLSYLATKFARSCRLPIPCLLCSRLDHFFGNAKPGFYRDFLCHAHKEEFSFLAYCCNHGRLINVQEMCEGCLLSSATEIRPKADKNKYHGEDPVKVPDSLYARKCSCCYGPIRSRSNTNLLVQSKAMGADISESGFFSSVAAAHGCVRHRDGSRKRREESMGIYNSCAPGCDHMSHGGCNELKIASDSESEIPFSDDDGNKYLNDETVARSLQTAPVSFGPKGRPVDVSDDMVPEKLIHPNPIILDTSISDPERKLKGESLDKSSVESNDVTTHVLDEIIWSHADVRNNVAESPETISNQIPIEVYKAKDVVETGNMECVSSCSNGGVTKALGSSGITSQTVNDRGLSARSSADRNDSFKFSVRSKASQSPRVSEIVAGKDSSRVPEELKIRLSQLSSTRGNEFLWNDMISTPKLPTQGDEPKLSDASSSAGFQNVTKRLLERNNSALELFDINLVNEIEGESPLDRLKRQVELDRKFMGVLCKELDEERSASAIAANQAMAMINRLQEEKASMQMEALQYLRMMEEQAEYDQEAIQKLNDILTEREKEILDLEAEFESYRNQVEDESFEGKVLKPLENSEEQTGSRIVMDELLEIEDEKAYISECLRRLEKELRLLCKNGVHADGYILDAKEDCQADKKCHVNRNGVNDEQENASLGKNAKKGGSEVAGGDNELKHCQRNNSIQENGHMEGEVFSGNGSSSFKEHSNAKARSVPSTQGAQFAGDENHVECRTYSDTDHEIQKPSGKQLIDIIYIENEVWCLNKRLEALEADGRFLEHTMDLLMNGNGVKFVQEIACHLRELRRIGITKREQVVV